MGDLLASDGNAINYQHSADNPAVPTSGVGFAAYGLALVSMTIFRDKTPGRMRGRKLQQARAAAFARNPLCHGPDSECEKLGRVRVWVTRDHRNPLGKGGPDMESNCQYLCAECDYSKTNRDLGRRDKVAIGIDGWPIK